MILKLESEIITTEELVKEIKTLAIIYDDQLKWYSHIHLIVAS